MKTNGLSGRRGGRARETERERERRVGDGEHCGSVSLVTRLFPHKPSGWTFAGINGSELTIFIAIVFGYSREMGNTSTSIEPPLVNQSVEKWDLEYTTGSGSVETVLQGPFIQNAPFKVEKTRKK